MTSHEPPSTDPLAPIEFVVTVVSALLALLFLVTIPLTVFGSGSVLGIGDSEACATVRSGAVPYFVADGVRPSEGVEGLRSTARSWPERLQICDRHPSLGVKAASVVSIGLDLGLLLGFLWLTRRLVRIVRSQRLFTPAAAACARALGWFLLLGSVAVAMAGSVARGIVISSAVDDVSWTDGLRDFDMPWTVIIAGVGVLSFSRVLRQAVELQDDVDTTI
jgi:hypothetical protein